MVRLFGYFCCALFLLITSLSCDSSEPLINNGAKLTLAVEDSSSTELWLRLTSSNIPLPISISLNQTDSQNNSVLQTISLCCNDTLLYIDSLLPKQTYKFKAGATNYQLPGSNELNTQTMDTTSHNFSWQSWEFGEHSTSVLYDVAIIDENNIWAVGEIYMNDSLGNPDPKRYNAAIWNGTEWKIKRIPYNYQETDFINPIQSVFAFGQTDIWFCGNGIIHWDGSNYIPVSIPTDVWGPYQMNKLWGTSSEDLYVVGNGGNIAHYSGVSGGWQKIESGTELNINDIWGDYNVKSGDWEILAVAANVNTGFEKKIFKINSENVIEITTSNQMEPLRSVWFVSNRKHYVAGSGIYEKHYLSDIEWENMPLDITTYFTDRIRGNSINDVIGVGAFGDVTHFNGWEWKNDYTEPNLSFGSYFSVDIKNDIVAAVGLEFNQAVILIGKRN